MNPVIVADSIVNIAGAIGVGVAILTFQRRDPTGEVTRLMNAALAALFCLLLTRGIHWWTGSSVFQNLSLAFAALVPLASLIATEAALRRHAPRQLKMALLTASGLMIPIALSGLHGQDMWFGLPLALVQLCGFGASGWLLWRRNHATLTASENQSIQRLLLAFGLAVPFIATDFRVLFPDIPVRLGALGVLIAVSLLLVAASMGQTRRQLLVLLVWRIASAGALGWAAAHLLPEPTLADFVRFSAIAVAGVLGIGLMVDALRALYESRAPGIVGAISSGKGETRTALLEELQQHPLFNGAKRLKTGDLPTFDPDIIGPVLANRSVLRIGDWPWSMPERDPAAERLLSLLRTHGATHLIVLSGQPLDVVLVQVPLQAADPATETALALVRRLLVASPEMRP